MRVDFDPDEPLSPAHPHGPVTVCKRTPPMPLSSVQLLAVSMIRQALLDIKLWCRTLDARHKYRAIVQLGWVRGTRGEITSHECCEVLDVEHGRLLSHVVSLPNIEKLV